MIPRRFFWLFDIIAITLAFITVYAFFSNIRLLFLPGGFFWSPWLVKLSLPSANEAEELSNIARLLWILLAATPITLISLEIFRLYRPLLQQSAIQLIAGATLSPLVGTSFIILILFALKQLEWSRFFIFSFTLLSGFFLFLYRIILRYFYTQWHKAGYFAKNIVFISSRESASWFVSKFRDFVPLSDYQPWGYLDIDDNNQTPLEKEQNISNSLPLLGSVNQLGELFIHHPIHEVIVFSPINDENKWLIDVIKECDYFKATLRIIPEIFRSEVLNDFFSLHKNNTLLPYPEIVLAPRQFNADTLFVKRLIDIVISSILLLLLLPLFLIIALIIKITTPNLPIFYKWKVVGKNGVEFVGYKFTTMYADADFQKNQLEEYNEMTGPVFKMKNDPRITPLGKLLRKYSLNELPQLWSVLKGDMSLVGPRPAFRHELNNYKFWHKKKLSIQPGITCLWQISGRNKINDFDEWVKLDLEYIDKWSLWLDFKILLKTVWVVISGSGW